MTGIADEAALAPIAWSPNGSLIAFFARAGADLNDATLKVIPIDGGTARTVADVRSAGPNNEIAWSPDGNYIAMNGPGETVITIISLEDGSAKVVEPHLRDAGIYHLDWSPDGRRFAFVGHGARERGLWLMEDFMPLAKAAGQE
jgi:Tol biopolymer transport system component